MIYHIYNENQYIIQFNNGESKLVGPGSVNIKTNLRETAEWMRVVMTEAVDARWTIEEEE